MGEIADRLAAALVQDASGAHLSGWLERVVELVEATETCASIPSIAYNCPALAEGLEHLAQALGDPDQGGVDFDPSTAFPYPPA